MVNYRDILQEANANLYRLNHHVFDVIEVKQPDSVQSVMSLSKTISKLSPLVGNMIEFQVCDFLNEYSQYRDIGKWYRQDPGFPDTIFRENPHSQNNTPLDPLPGMEVKAWFPFSTEITARFKDSQTHFLYDQTNVALIAWLPEFIIFGRPLIIKAVSIPASKIAYSRDNHYNNPPDYLVLEPEDTTLRTSNLQQTNMNGLKFQGNETELEEAKKIVKSWGLEGKPYSSSVDYQLRLRSLSQKYNYRLDTNFAKIDRIKNPEIAQFKSEVMQTYFHGQTIDEWRRILTSNNTELIINKLVQALKITLTN